MRHAVTYARSSKDRSDVSIAAQNHELAKLASSKSLAIVEEFNDSERRGSSEDRPSFQRLISAIKRRDRGWSDILIYDTSRIARKRFIAQMFNRECEKYGVHIHYVKLPEVDPISLVILQAVFEAMDEVHSLMSRDKALAGMAENIRRGFRAGGRAPWGYRLQHEPTGAVRDGKPVTKSKLVLGPEASVVRRYLAARADGVPRAVAAKGTGRSESSLVDIEWNALTYAGHTTFGRHIDKRQRGSGATKRHPRDKWQIERNTHEALIGEAQAECLLSALEASVVGEAVSRAKRARSGFLLTEVLEAPDGRRWEGSGKHYRLKALGEAEGRWVPADLVDTAVLQKLREDLGAEAFLERLLDTSQAAAPKSDPTAPIRTEIARLAKEKDKAARLALGEGGDAFVKLIPELSGRIAALEREMTALEAEATATHAVHRMTVADLRQLLASFDDDRALVAALQRVVLDPDTLGAEMTYRVSMASPRGFEPLSPP